MNLGFLNPWLWLGALAVAAPLWLHLRRRPDTNRHLFSAVQFLADSPRPRQRPRQLQDPWLFLLRALAVVLLAGAFAWPYLREQAPVVRESRVYLLDNTLSHQAGGAFERERDRLAREIAAAEPDVQVAVVELTGQPRVLAGFGEPREEMVRRLAALAPSFQRGSYLAAFRQAQDRLDHSLGERRRIVLRGDNQENQWTENAHTPPFLRGVAVDLPKPAATNAPSVSVAEPRLQRVFLGDRSLVHCSVKLTHATPATNAVVTLRANRQGVVERSVPLAPGHGNVLLQAQWEADPSLWLAGEVTVSSQPDALEGDNRVVFALPPVREGEVVLLARSPYLRVALSPDVMKGHWRTRVLDPAALAEEVAANHDAEVLCLEASYLQSAEARKLVWRYLTNGRGVFLLVDRITPSVTGALRELGFELPRSTAADTAGPSRLQYFFSNHPILHPFASPDYGNLLEVTVNPACRLNAIDGMALIFAESGDPVLFQGTRFPGRLLVTTFGFDREQTSWPTHVTFIPFLDLCLQNARIEDATPTEYEPGAAAVLTFPPDSTVREVALRDEAREVQRVVVAEGRAQLALPDRPGVYEVRFDAAPEPAKMFCVNPSPKESELTYVSEPEAIRQWQRDTAGVPQVQPRPSGAIPVSRATVGQQRLWWWLLASGLGLLCVESLWTTARKALT